MSLNWQRAILCLWNQFHVFTPAGDVVVGGAGVLVKNIYTNNLSYSNIKCYYCFWKLPKKATAVSDYRSAILLWSQSFLSVWYPELPSNYVATKHQLTSFIYMLMHFSGIQATQQQRLEIQRQRRRRRRQQVREQETTETKGGYGRVYPLWRKWIKDFYSGFSYFHQRKQNN